MNYSLTSLNRNLCHIVFNKEHFLFFPESLKLVKTDTDTIDSVTRRSDLNGSALTENRNKDVSENELDKKLNQFCTINGKEKYEHNYYNSSSLQYLNLNLTHQCNMKCSYCYAGYGEYLNKSKNKKMNIDVAIKAVDLFFNNVKKNKQKLFIDFFGGEPLLNIPVLKKVVTYIKKQYPQNISRLEYSVSTNGLLLSNDLCKYLKKNNIHIHLSLDGNKEIHDENRKTISNLGSYNKIMEQVEPNLLSMPELFSVRATITRKFPDVNKIMNHFKETGFIYKSFDIASGDYDQETTGWTKKDLEKYDNNFFKYVDKIFSEAGKDSIAEIIETADKLNRLHKRKPLFSACRMSRALMVVTPEGDIFPCYRLSEREDFTIGNVFNGINEEKKQSLYPKLSFNRDICRDCWARYLCGGGCAAESFIKNGHDYEPCETVCHARKISWKWHIWLYLKFHTENPLFLNRIKFL